MDEQRRSIGDRIPYTVTDEAVAATGVRCGGQTYTHDVRGAVVAATHRRIPVGVKTKHSIRGRGPGMGGHDGYGEAMGMYVQHVGNIF